MLGEVQCRGYDDHGEEEEEEGVCGVLLVGGCQEGEGLKERG